MRRCHRRRLTRSHFSTEWRISMSSLKDKTAIITGANSGIGLATAKAFLDDGAARVYLTGRRKDELEEAVRALGTRAVAVPGDVTVPADLDRLCDVVKSE